MQPFSSIYYATPTPAQAETKPENQEGDSPSCCTRIMNVFKCIISWIVCIFTLGCCRVFETNKNETPEENQTETTPKEIAKEAISSKKPYAEAIKLFDKVTDQRGRNSLIGQYIKKVIIKEASLINAHLITALSEISDDGWRERLVVQILQRGSRHTFFSLGEMLNNPFELCEKLLAMVKTPENVAKAASGAVTVLNRIKDADISFDRTMTFIKMISKEHLDDRLDAISDTTSLYDIMLQDQQSIHQRGECFLKLIVYIEECKAEDALNAEQYNLAIIKAYEDLSSMFANTVSTAKHGITLAQVNEFIAQIPEEYKQYRVNLETVRDSGSVN